jgi:hypothetical protein
MLVSNLVCKMRITRFTRFLTTTFLMNFKQVCGMTDHIQSTCFNSGNGTCIATKSVLPRMSLRTTQTNALRKDLRSKIPTTCLKAHSLWTWNTFTIRMESLRWWNKIVLGSTMPSWTTQSKLNQNCGQKIKFHSMSGAMSKVPPENKSFSKRMINSLRSLELSLKPLEKVYRL